MFSRMKQTFLSFWKHWGVWMSRWQVYTAVLACIWIPCLFSCWGLFPQEGRKEVWIFWVALWGSLGSAAAWTLLRLWEGKMQRSVARLVKSRLQRIETHGLPGGSPVEEIHQAYEQQIALLHTAVVKSKGEVEQLHREMDQKFEEMRVAYLEYEDIRKECKRLEEERQKGEKEREEAQAKHQTALEDYQKIIAEQRQVIEKKQRYIAKLEGRVGDLMYEIRGLLQLEHPGHVEEAVVEDVYKNAPCDLAFALQATVRKIEELSGMDGRKPSPGGIGNPLLHVRPLAEAFRETADYLVVVALPKEDALLFVPPRIKQELGWSSEKVMQDFPHLVTRGYPAWKELCTRCVPGEEMSITLTFQTKGGGKRSFLCQATKVGRGPFLHHIVALWQPLRSDTRVLSQKDK